MVQISFSIKEALIEKESENMLKWFMLIVYLVFLIDALAHMFYALNMFFGANKRRNILVAIVVFAIAVTIMAGVCLPKSEMKHTIVTFSNYWLGFFIYLITFLTLMDIGLLIGKKICKKKNKTFNPTLKKKLAFGLTILVVASSLIWTVYGAIHERILYTSTYDIQIDKDGGTLDELKIVLVADLHLGYSIGSKDMERMVSLINEQDADIVLLAGDIYDNNYDSLDDPERIAEIFRGIQSRMGVYAIYGNHDVTEPLVGGFPIGNPLEAYRDERIETLMEESHITMLEDDVLYLADSFYLVGRLDGERPGAGPMEREDFDNLLNTIDFEKPVLVMNHEPDELSMYAEKGVDLLLSGHTHAGQFFPLTIVQPFAWENHWGLKKINQMYSIVTSGVGVYGPPIRSTTNSEIVVLNVTFNK